MSITKADMERDSRNVYRKIFRKHIVGQKNKRIKKKVWKRIQPLIEKEVSQW